jgi:hypothetical protein
MSPELVANSPCRKVLARALSMHLQVCWDITPGVVFFYCSQFLGWGVVGLLFTVTMIFTGVSNRFGESCHVESAHSMKDFWGPIIGFAAISTILQLATYVPLSCL